MADRITNAARGATTGARSLVAIGLVAGSLVAAQNARVLGLAVDAQGRPWAGARITLVSRPVPWREDVGELHSVSAVAAADGTFNAELRDGQEYAAWAQAPAGADGQLFSEIAESVIAGAALRLAADPAPRAPLRVLVSGAAAWRAAGQTPFVRIVWSTPIVLHERATLDESGAATLPPGPGRSTLVQVLSGDGVPIASAVVDLGPATAPVRLVLPPPRTERVVFSRADGGAPTAGATVRIVSPLHVWPYAAGFGPEGRDWRSCGRALIAGPDASLVATLPETPREDQPVQLEVAAPGAARTRVALDPGPRNTQVRERSDASGPLLHVAVGPGQTLRGRILRSAREPASGLRLYVWHTVAFRQVASTVRTDADGAFVLDGLEPGEWLSLVALTSDLPPDLARPAAGVPLAPVTLLTYGVTDKADRHDMGAVRLDWLYRARLRARLATGPAADTRFRFYAGPHFHTRWEFGSNDLGLGNRAGALDVLIAVDTGGFLAIAPGAYGLTEWRAGRERGVGGVTQLAMQPMVSVRGRVRNLEGHPLADAVVMVGELAGGGSARDFAGRAMEDLDYLGLRGTSSADGSFEVFFLPLPGLRLRLAAFLPGRNARSDVGPWLADEPIEGLELAVPAPGGGERR